MVDRSRCVGAGECARLSPDLFAQDEADGLVVLRDKAGPAEDRAALQAVVLACPSGAITIER